MSWQHTLATEASGVLELVNAGANLLFRLGLARVERADVPVISVGNIACGGTGKTPLVAALARELQRLGHRPAILTRGYNRQRQEPLLVTENRTVSWQEAGDEPALLARALPSVPLVVDADRVRGAATAVRETAATHLILDDGFQHWRLHRDADIVVVDAGDPLAHHSPRRERPATLARATGVVINRVTDRSEAAAVMAWLGPWAPEAAMIATKVVPCALHRGSERLPVEILKGQKVVVLAGLGNPETFVNTVGDLGAVVVDLQLHPDHHRYRRSELLAAVEAGRRSGAVVVTTGKDIVKVPPDLAGELLWIEVELVPVFGTFSELLRPALA